MSNNSLSNNDVTALLIPTDSTTTTTPPQPSPSKSSDHTFLSSLKTNPLFTAGAGVAGIGIGVQLARRFFLQGLQMAQKYYTVSLEIPSKDRSYQWVLQYLSRYSTNSSSQHQAVETHYHQLSN